MIVICSAKLRYTDGFSHSFGAENTDKKHRQKTQTKFASMLFDHEVSLSLCLTILRASDDALPEAATTAQPEIHDVPSDSQNDSM